MFWTSGSELTLIGRCAAGVCTLLSLRVTFSRQILICSGINGDDSLIDPLSRVIIGVAAEQSNDHALALKCYERSAQEGSWHAMRKLAALFVVPPLCAACGMI